MTTTSRPAAGILGSDMNKRRRYLAKRRRYLAKRRLAAVARFRADVVDRWLLASMVVAFAAPLPVRFNTDYQEEDTCHRI